MRRISNTKPGALSHYERNVLSDVVKEMDSDFRVKAGSIPDVSKVIPEPGVVVLNEYDGLTYYADNYGWHKSGAEYSPIQIYVEYDGATQFAITVAITTDAVVKISYGDGSTRS